MILDAQLMFSDSQPLTASAYGTNVIDLGVGRNLGDGEPMSIVITVDTGLAGTTPTFAVQIRTDDNAAMSSPTTLSNQTVAASELGTGGQVVVSVPVGAQFERYMSVYYTLGGTSPSTTVTAFLQPTAMIASQRHYADAITIS